MNDEEDLGLFYRCTPHDYVGRERCPECVPDALYRCVACGHEFVGWRPYGAYESCWRCGHEYLEWLNSERWIG